jgi:signal transduction histidine kinase
VRVGQRLFLAVIPAVLGVVTVAGLAYWGQYAHAAPAIVVVTAAIASVASLAMAWLNTRYVAQRIEQLASKVEGTRRPAPKAGIRAVADAMTGRVIENPGTDELDAIERVVDRHASALAKAEADRVRAEETASARIREHGELLAQVTAAVSHALDEIRLPLHILLENRFGDLNENQEEMLVSARAAAESSSADLRRLAELADLDRGQLVLRRDRVHLADVIESLKPTLESEAARAGVRIETSVAPALPPMLADRGRLQEALALVLADCVRRTSRGGTVRIAVEGVGGALRMDVTHGAPSAADLGSALAERLVDAHGGRVERSDGRTIITVPVARVVGTV